jgi:hypothetical protein
MDMEGDSDSSDEETKRRSSPASAAKKLKGTSGQPVQVGSRKRPRDHSPSPATVTTAEKVATESQLGLGVSFLGQLVKKMDSIDRHLAQLVSALNGNRKARCVLYVRMTSRTCCSFMAALDRMSQKHKDEDSSDDGNLPVSTFPDP